MEILHVFTLCVMRAYVHDAEKWTPCTLNLQGKAWRKGKIRKQIAPAPPGVVGGKGGRTPKLNMERDACQPGLRLHFR